MVSKPAILLKIVGGAIVVRLNFGLAIFQWLGVTRGRDSAVRYVRVMFVVFRVLIKATVEQAGVICCAFVDYL